MVGKHGSLKGEEFDLGKIACWQRCKGGEGWVAPFLTTEAVLYVAFNLQSSTLCSVPKLKKAKGQF